MKNLAPRPKPGLLGSRQASTAVEFAICALALVLIIVGCTEFGRLIWTFEVLQEAATEGARCMGLRASGCASSGVYNSTSTKNYVVSVATSRGVAITGPMLTLSNAATCGGASGFSEVTITYNFKTVAPALLSSLAGGFTVPASACFPNNS
jgi:Flp pilus assembly protein TadG